MREDPQPTISPKGNVWVEGIGPPLRQLEEDYAESTDRPGLDVLALIREVYRQRRECPFCLWSGERYDLAVHLEDCSGRRGYLGR